MAFQILYLFAIGGSISFFIIPFRTPYHQGPRWIRTAHFIAALSVAAWALTGILARSYREHLSELTLWRLDHFHWFVGGIFLGVLALLLLSRDYHALRRSSYSR